MDEDTLKRLSDDIDDLKRAIKQNDPLLHEVAAPPGWTAFSIAAGINLSLFALPAHFLVARYGSFGAIPLPARIGLFAVLALFVVGGGTMKIGMMSKRATELDGKAGFMKVIDSFYGGKIAHVTYPLTLGMIAGSAYAFYAGHPWMSLPITAFMFGVTANLVGNRSGLRSYYAVGYWGVALGLVAAPFVESAPYLWLFAIYACMFFVFAAAQCAAEKAPRR